MKQNRYSFNVLSRMMLALGVLGGGAWATLQLLGGVPAPTLPLGQRENLDPALTGEPEPNPSPQTFKQVANVPRGLFSYGGGIAWAPIRREMTPALQSAWPEFQLRYTQPPLGAPGSTPAIQMLLKDELAFAQSARGLTEAEFQQAGQRGLTLRQVPAALDAIVVAAHPDLPLEGLTLLQLRSLYTGKITNWRQIGGPDLPVIPYSRAISTGGAVEQFQREILQGAEFAPSVQTVRDTTQALRLIAQNPGGIYYGSGAAIIGQCTVKPLALGRGPESLVAPYVSPRIPPAECPQRRNPVNQTAIRSGDYPFTRRLFVIIKENGQADEEAGRAFAELALTEQGQTLIEKAGLTPLR
ncbi:MAG: PstS family phosphate ABC transporter substrate-binding protein [Cyanobacteriota bacterium]